MALTTFVIVELISCLNKLALKYLAQYIGPEGQAYSAKLWSRYTKNRLGSWARDISWKEFPEKGKLSKFSRTFVPSIHPTDPRFLII